MIRPIVFAAGLSMDLISQFDEKNVAHSLRRYICNPSCVTGFVASGPVPDVLSTRTPTPTINGLICGTSSGGLR